MDHYNNCIKFIEHGNFYTELHTAIITINNELRRSYLICLKSSEVLIKIDPHDISSVYYDYINKHEVEYNVKRLSRPDEYKKLFNNIMEIIENKFENTIEDIFEDKVSYIN